MADHKAEEIAMSEGGPKTNRSTISRSTQHEAGKMENSLEANKANKVSTAEADQVAGRKGKGSGTGLLEKMMPSKD